MLHAWNAEVPAFSIIRNLVHLCETQLFTDTIHNSYTNQWLLREALLSQFSHSDNFVRVQTIYQDKKKPFELFNIISTLFFIKYLWQKRKNSLVLEILQIS